MTTAEFIKTAKNTLLDILFPPICLGCDKTFGTKDLEDNLCGDCLGNILIHQTLFCAVCMARLPDNSKICHKDSGFLLGAAANYDDKIIQKLIWLLKYEKNKSAAAPLAKILNMYVGSLAIDFSDFLVIPMPLHFLRLKKRGFNQSALLGEKLSKTSGLKLISGNLFRVKNTKPQAEVADKKEREANVLGCFSISRAGELDGKNIILIDDVYTTGATASEAVRVLRNAGVKKVLVVVVAKAR